jgi:hypothetical protein
MTRRRAGDSEEHRGVRDQSVTDTKDAGSNPSIGDLPVVFLGGVIGHSWEFRPTDVDDCQVLDR